MINTRELEQSVRQTAMKETQIGERYRIAEARQLQLCQEIEDVDAMLSRKDDVLRAIHQVTLSAQARNKGLFEDMLTDLVNTVMPGNVDKIVLTSRMRNNKANLDFDAIVGGRLRNIDKDLGGSIANLTAMGLRFIVLARHPNRRVLFLDESDCHINEAYTSAFAAFMQYLSQKIGIQVVYVSHSDPRHFAGHGRVLQLNVVNGKSAFKTIAEEPEPDDEYEAPESALRYIRLQNYGPHENIMVELSPRLTIITGDNNKGKSKFIQAMLELCTNSGEEGRIRDDMPYFEVEVGIEEGMSILWKYERKGNKKTSMVLRDANLTVVEESDMGTGVPEWLHTYLSMAPVEGQNINFQTQKQQNFILNNEMFTSGQRAMLLPLGRESRDVMRINQMFNEKVTEARAKRASLEKYLNVYQNQLAIMSLVVQNPYDPLLMQRQCAEILEALGTLESMEADLKRLETLQSKVTLLDEADGKLSRVPANTVKLMASDELATGINQIEVLTRSIGGLKQLAELPAMRDAPVLQVEYRNEIGQAGAKLKKLREMVAALGQLKDLKPADVPKITDTSELQDSIQRLAASHTSLEKSRTELTACQEEMKRIETQRAELHEALGGVCPTCNGPLKEHSHD